MDITTIIGTILGIASVVLAYVLEGGAIGVLFQPTAALIVFGGTIGAVVTSFGINDLKKMPAYFRVLFKNTSFDSTGAYQILIKNAEKARREGLLSLEQDLTTLDNEFMRQGLQLVVDGTDPELTKAILENEIDAMETRHKAGSAILESAGGFAPTMGIIGTVMGLVHVLGNLSSPDSLGPSIAVAFIATLYGVGSANLLWLPMASKLKSKDKEEGLLRELILDGVLSIQAGENPTILKEKLKTHLGPAHSKQLNKESDAKTNLAEETA